ncbi:DNA repair protein RAD50-like [Rhopalosiphum maidis]|uniref:DNA repair protein RAD50-like n=1 Tax=Rhopalosiphum maidis TaxID=43146 RepID=UPI000EFE110B|nr:DNA repair protein RAD50-like [Rhopalosiphum maidis]
MDTIKKYFTQSIVDNVNKSMDENDESSVSTIFNKTQDEDMTISPFSKSVDKTSIQYTNKHFLHKIKSLEEENDRLLSIIENKNIIKNSSLKCNCNNNNNIPDFANKKILQLTEKVNELMSELQIIKSSASDDYAKNKDSSEIKQLTDKYNLLNKKTCNYRNQIMQLKNDLKITQNALSNEIGDPAMMQTVLMGTGSSNYIGRAQKILVLQQKVNELQAKQSDSKTKELHNLTVNTRKMEKAHKAISDQVLKDAQSKVSELTKSVEIWKSRSKALDVEITVLRIQIQKLLSKSESDNQLINQLKAELSNNNMQRCKTKDSVIKLEESITLLQSKYDKAVKVIEQQAFDLNDRNMRISHLESKVLKNNDITKDHNMCSIDFMDPKEIFIKKLNGFENQQLVELLSIAHNKICEHVLDAVNFKNKYLTEKQKLQKFESKMGYLGSSTLFKQRSNSISYHFKHELNPNEKLVELQNKLELVEEECAAFKDRLDTLIMLNKENVHTFTRSLNNIKQQLIH